MKDLEGKVSEDEIKKAKDAKEALEKAQKDNNLDEMKAKKDDLSKIVQDLSVKLYQQAQEAQGQAADGAQANAGDAKTDDDNTVNGDFEEVDPDKDNK